MAFTDRLHNRGSIPTGYDIDYSCKFEQDNSESMTRTATQSQGGNRKTWTWSGWIKRTELGRHMYLFSAGGTGLQILGSDNIRFALYYNNTSYYLDLNAKLRDTSAWYHIVGQLDTTQSTAQDRVKVYINGVRQTSFDNDSAHNIPQNADVQHLNEATGTSTGWMKIGDWYASGRFFSGYAAEWHFTDGVANDPTEFGEFDTTSSIWKPKEYDGSYGTNGFYLDFADGADLGDDESGNGNDFSEGNLTAADQSTDTPTNNFSTFNVLHPYSSASNHNPTFTEGATRFTTLLPGYWEAAVASMGITSGKWYFEAQPGTSTSHITSIGYGDESDIHDWGQDTADTNGFPGEGGTNSIGYLGSDTSSSYGNIWLGTGSTSNVNANYTISNIVGVAIDADNGYVYFARDNTYVNSGNPGSGASGTGGYTFQDVTTPRTGTVFPAVAGYYHTAATVININFGGYTTISISSAETDENGYGTFEYAPPSGYYALCSKNLAEYG